MTLLRVLYLESTYASACVRVCVCVCVHTCVHTIHRKQRDVKKNIRCPLSSDQIERSQGRTKIKIRRRRNTGFSRTRHYRENKRDLCTQVQLS